MLIRNIQHMHHIAIRNILIGVQGNIHGTILLLDRAEVSLQIIRRDSYRLLSAECYVVIAKVIDTHDYGTHTLFVAEVTEAQVISPDPSVTYAYYFAHIKPKPQPKAEEKADEKKVVWVCKICGYVYEGDPIPEDFICPLCKHPASDFEKIE